MNDVTWLPMVFILLVAFAVIMYAILDGYDLGVGMLLPLSEDQMATRDAMIASIGPFWDANETWLVLAVGLLLVAFPQAHNIILRELYLPVTLLLVCLILRGVAFDFRAKALTKYRLAWDKCFRFGSLGAALAQGYMLGRYVLGFEVSLVAQLFALASAVCVSAAYAFIGSAWLIIKTEGDLQRRAIGWARRAAIFTAIGLVLVSAANPFVSDFVYLRWFSYPNAIFVGLIPVVCAVLFVINDRYLNMAPTKNDSGCWVPFVSAVLIFILSFIALAYSFYPYVVPGQLTIWQAASASESLLFLFYGAVVVVPFILAYTVFAYWVFWGKSHSLKYH